MMDHKTSLVGFFLGLLAVVTSAFGITVWFLTEASSTTTLTLMIVIATFGVITQFIFGTEPALPKTGLASNG